MHIVFKVFKLKMKTDSKAVRALSGRYGFTLIELIVVIAIFSIIMSVALYNQSGLNSSILTNNFAYELALNIREAQSYGIGVRAKNDATINPESFRNGFGIYTDLGSNANRMIIFQDKNDDKAYSVDETFINIDMAKTNGNRIVAICADHDFSTGPCVSGAPTAYTQASILFKRPNPEAAFAVSRGGAGAVEVKSGPVVFVVNNGANKNCKAVVVEATGQIHIESALSPSPACSN